MSTHDQLLDYATDDGNFNPQVLEVRNALFDFLKWYEICPIMTPKIKWDESRNSSDALRYIVGMADLLSYLRCVAQVWETSAGSDYDYRKSEREVPVRAIACLKNLAKGHALLTGRNYIPLEGIPIVIKTALDTASIESVSMFRILIADNGILTKDQVLESLNVSKSTALKTMAEFEAIGLVIVEEFNDGEVNIPSGRMVLNPRFNWFLGDKLIKIIIPHTHTNFNSDNGNGKRIDLFWKTYDQLQEEEAAYNQIEADKNTVNGKKLEERLISTGQFYIGDAAKIIKEMVKAGMLKEIMMDTYTRV